MQSKTVEEMKELIKLYTKQQKEKLNTEDLSFETVTLYHGTTAKHLNDIMKNGLTPRKHNQISNFKDVPSNEELVYLTTKWHYWYAYKANQESLIRQVGGERFFYNECIETLWNETSDFPVYLECEVPIEFLTLDEDVVYQSDIKKEIRNGIIQKPEDITIERCFAQGTIASLQPILPEYISSISILGNPEYKSYLLDGEYGYEATRWFRGFGIGDVSVNELLMIELTKFRKGNEVLELSYPIEEMQLIERIFYDKNGELIVQTKA